MFVSFTLSFSNSSTFADINSITCLCSALPFPEMYIGSPKEMQTGSFLQIGPISFNKFQFLQKYVFKENGKTGTPASLASLIPNELNFSGSNLFCLVPSGNKTIEVPLEINSFPCVKTFRRSWREFFLETTIGLHLLIM